MQTKEQNKRYVADECLGEATLFRSFLGQRLGLMNTKVASWIVFGSIKDWNNAKYISKEKRNLLSRYCFG